MSTERGKSMWVFNIYKKAKMKDRLLFTFVVFLLPIVVIFIPYLIKNFTAIIHYKFSIILALFFAMSWSFLGPLLINNYFEKLNGFIKKVDETADNTNDLIADSADHLTAQSVYDSCSIHFKKICLIFFFLWDGILMFILLKNADRMRFFSFFGYQDPYYWILLLYISFIAYLQAIGFSELIICNQTINKLLKRKKFIENVIESDFENGIKLFGSMITTTTLSFFSGIAYFPILIEFCKQQSVTLYLLVIPVMLIFLVSLILYFCLSAYNVWKCAKERKDRLIGEFQELYNTHMKASLNNTFTDKTDVIINELKIHNINEHIERLGNININPIGAGNFLATLFTVIFPMLFFITDFAQTIELVKSFF